MFLSNHQPNLKDYGYAVAFFTSCSNNTKFTCVINASKHSVQENILLTVQAKSLLSRIAEDFNFTEFRSIPTVFELSSFSLVFKGSYSPWTKITILLLKKDFSDYIEYMHFENYRELEEFRRSQFYRVL